MVPLNPPRVPSSLIEFLAIRLMLDRIALHQTASDLSGVKTPLSELREKFRRDNQQAEPNHFDLSAFTVFQLAQVLGRRPRNLENLAPQQWEALVSEIETFPSLERRRIYHRAFERKYRNETLDAVIAHSNVPGTQHTIPPLFQIASCIDEREESFRRHLEEIQPDCETLGIAGFFGIAMYYRGAGDAHFTPLCPVNVKPDHYVVETPVDSAMEVERRRAAHDSGACGGGRGGPNARAFAQMANDLRVRANLEQRGLKLGSEVRTNVVGGSSPRPSRATGQPVGPTIAAMRVSPRPRLVP